ncbi:MAG TPA: response regulator [Desulfuromonadales bacterium]|nr:response regulator [Desulfuromonadales bacterium]
MKNKRVLVVDNEPQRRDSLQRLLGERNIETLAAATCEEALQLLAGEQVDLVLTETELPGKSGHYLLKQVKERQPEIEVILITHNASSYNLLQALRNNACDFIVRPIDTGEILFSALERAFTQIDLRRQNADLLKELEKSNRSLRRTLKMMKALNASIERLTATTDIEELFMELLSSAMGELQASRGFLALFDRASGKLGLKVSKGIPPELCRKYSAGLPDGLTLALARRGKPVAIAANLPEKLAAMAAPGETENLLPAPGLLAAPLLLKERVAGIVVLSGHQNGQGYGEHELNFLSQLSHHAALALEKVGIIHQLKRDKSSVP